MAEKKKVKADTVTVRVIRRRVRVGKKVVGRGETVAVDSELVEGGERAGYWERVS